MGHWRGQTRSLQPECEPRGDREALPGPDLGGALFIHKHGTRGGTARNGTSVQGQSPTIGTRVTPRAQAVTPGFPKNVPVSDTAGWREPEGKGTRRFVSTGNGKSDAENSGESPGKPFG